MRPLLPLVTLPLLLAGCGGGGGSDPAEDALVVGLVPSREANVLVDNAEPLAEYLTEALGQPVRVFVPQDYTGLVEAMGSGHADVGLIPPFAAMLGNERYGFETLLVSVRHGTATYRAQWMTNDPSLCPTPPEPGDDGILHCDAPIDVIRGRRVGFTDPSSTSGYLFPALQLMESGIDPETDVQPVFLGGHDAAVIATYHGDVEIGVCWEGGHKLVEAELPDMGSKIIAFATTDPIPNDGVTVRADLDSALKDAIRQAFLDLAEREESQPKSERILWAIYEIDGFVPFEDGLHDVVERAFRQLRDKIDV